MTLSTLLACPVCQRPIAAETLDCPHCRAPLHPSDFENPFPPAPRQQRVSWLEETLAQTAGDAQPPDGSLSIEGCREIITLPAGKAILFGHGFQPPAHPARELRIDLAAFGALEKGVSHLHALVFRADHRYVLYNLSSTNGTWLNGYPLVACCFQLLGTVNRLRLGALEMHLFLPRDTI